MFYFKKKKRAAVFASGKTVEIPPEEADHIFEETETSEISGTHVEKADDPVRFDIMSDRDESRSDEEDNKEETT